MNKLDDWGTRLDIPHNKGEAQAFLHWLIHNLKVNLACDISTGMDFHLTDYVNAKGEKRFTPYEAYSVGMILETCRLLCGDELLDMAGIELATADTVSHLYRYRHLPLLSQEIGAGPDTGSGDR